VKPVDLLVAPGAAAAFDPQAPTIVAVTLHARSVASAAREEFAAGLATLPFDSRLISISTCHRVEVYASPRAGGMPELPPLPPGTGRLVDVDAVRHLMEVACGLDSAVFGEDQVLHQLRTSLAERHRAGRLDPVLDRLFHAALRAGRRARSWLDGSPRSLADVALDRIARTVGKLDGRHVLVVGAGRMGRLAVFAARRRGARVLVMSRTDGRAAALAAEVGGTSLPFAGNGHLPALAGVIVALGGPWEPGPLATDLLASGEVEVVDLSFPPAVPAGLAARLASRLTSVDDLSTAPEFGPRERTRRRLESLVSEAGREYCAWLRGREAVPVIQALTSGAEHVRRAEVEWLLKRLPDMRPEERLLVDQMTHRLVAALLHSPLAALHGDDSGTLERPARDLFGI
jgi:glutamyl-tRNA reductase